MSQSVLLDFKVGGMVMMILHFSQQTEQQAEVSERQLWLQWLPSLVSGSQDHRGGGARVLMIFVQLGIRVLHRSRVPPLSPSLSRISVSHFLSSICYEELAHVITRLVNCRIQNPQSAN